MTTVRYREVLAIILVIVLHMATETSSAPDGINSPFIGMCDETVCGRGTCLPSTSTTFGFECECLPGWRQARPDDNNYFKFLPCIIPNCTLDYSCGDADVPEEGDNPPDSEDDIPNITNFDPCSLGDCGGGSCIRTSPFTRNCECSEGYYNLLNSTLFPCYRQCAFGTGCPGLGFNSSTLFLNPLFPGEFNAAASLVRGAEFACFITIVTTLARLVVLNHI